MNDYKSNLKGSPARDLFKQLHKLKMPPWNYGCDLDFRLVDKKPTEHVVADLDFKREGDSITFAEVIAYNHDVRQGIPVYIITGQKEFTNLSPQEHRFSIDQYLGGDYRPYPPEPILERIRDNMTWEELSKWENEVRNQSRMKLNGVGQYV